MWASKTSLDKQDKLNKKKKTTNWFEIWEIELKPVWFNEKRKWHGMWRHMGEGDREGRHESEHWTESMFCIFPACT